MFALIVLVDVIHWAYKTPVVFYDIVEDIGVLSKFTISISRLPAYNTDDTFTANAVTTSTFVNTVSESGIDCQAHSWVQLNGNFCVQIGLSYSSIINDTILTVMCQ